MEWWAILELPLWSELDYRLWGVTSYRWIPIKILPWINSTDTQYNQLEWSGDFWTNLCTIYACFTTYNNLWKNVLSPIRRKLVEKRYNLPDFNRLVGGYIPTANKLMVDEMQDTIMYRVNKSEVKGLIEKWYVVNIGIHWWNDIVQASKDWIISEEEIQNIKDKKWGHSTCIRYNKRLNSYEWVRDNNIITIENIDSFLNSWFVYDWCYTLVPTFVLRDLYNSIINKMNSKQAFNYYNKINKEMYPREKLIFQWCMQMKYIWKINTPELNKLKF